MRIWWLGNQGGLVTVDEPMKLGIEIVLGLVNPQLTVNTEKRLK